MISFDCSEKDQQLLLFLHHELPPFQALQIRLHLVICPSCRLRFERFRLASSALASAATGLPLAAPSATPKPGHILSRKRLRLAFATVLLALAILAYALYSSGYIGGAACPLQSNSPNPVAPQIRLNAGRAALGTGPPGQKAPSRRIDHPPSLPPTGSR